MIELIVCPECNSICYSENINGKWKEKYEGIINYEFLNKNKTNLSDVVLMNFIGIVCNRCETLFEKREIEEFVIRVSEKGKIYKKGEYWGNKTINNKLKQIIEEFIHTSG